MKFESFEKKLEIPAYLSCDFEAYLSKDDVDESNGAYRKHCPIAYGIQVVISKSFKHLPCFQKFVDHPTIINHWSEGKNLGREFIQTILKLGRELLSIIQDTNIPLIWRAGEKEAFENATVCHICEKEIKGDQIKVADHCHLSGNFRGNYTIKLFVILIIK